MLLIELQLRMRIGRLKLVALRICFMQSGRSLVYRLVYSGDLRRRTAITSVRQMFGAGRAHI
jgi:hypothetical protein